MGPVFLWEATLFAFVAFQLPAVTAPKIPIFQNRSDNVYIDDLKSFVTEGDPCRHLTGDPHPYTISQPSLECFKAVRGYINLQPHAKKNCPQANKGACNKSSSNTWYCAVTEKSTIQHRPNWFYSTPQTARRMIDLSYCIGNLDLFPDRSTDWHPRAQLTRPPSSSSARRIFILQTTKENEYIEQLRRYARGNDPCLRLAANPDPDSLANATARCLAAISGFKRLPPAAQCICPGIHKEGCRKAPDSEDWICVFDTIVVKRFIGTSEIGTVKLSYCIEHLDGLTPI